MTDDTTEPEIEGDDGDESAKARPWDPRDIRVGTKQWSLRQVVDEINDGTIDIAPDFQRGYVWKERQKIQLIESVLLGIPLPAFYFNQDKENRHQVVDGVQRLTTIQQYAMNAFRLEKPHLEYLEHLEGKLFKDLEPAVRRRFHQTQIVVHVIDARSPYDLKFNIFKRINTGGTRLEPQEIRHCMAKHRARDVLKSLVQVPDFAGAIRLKKCERMEDRELALRFVAFRRLIAGGGVEKYKSDERFEDFLNAAMEDLDDTTAVPDSEIENLGRSFTRAMTNCLRVFGRQAFRKKPTGGPLNRALFDCWTSALADVPTKDAVAVAQGIVERFEVAINSDEKFQNSVGYAIGNPERIQTRFNKAHDIVREALAVRP
jgi:hypothetical protein